MLNEFPRYLPFINGVYSTAPGLKPTGQEPQAHDRLIFQIDAGHGHYLANKQNCRRENIHKYYLEVDTPTATMQAVNRYLVSRLTKDYPDRFSLTGENFFINGSNDKKITVNNDWVTTQNSAYLSLFDALCSQVQEDIAVFQLTQQSDYLTAIHLCAPNHWSPAEKIGRPFDEIHTPVAGMEQTIKHYRRILESIVYKGGPFTRFAWGLGSDDRLNHHPEPPPGWDQTKWEGRFTSEAVSRIYVRVERQNLVGFPDSNAFLFTIRTYFYDVDSLTPHERQQLWKAVQGMAPESLAYKGLLEFARSPEVAAKFV